MSVNAGLQSERPREQGAALFVAVLMLAMMSLIGLASMDTVMRDRQVAGFQSRARTALYAAEAGVAWGQGIIYQQVQALAAEGVSGLYSFNPAFPTEAAPSYLGDGAVTNPSFMQDPDPAVPQAVDYIGKGQDCEGWIMSDEYGSAQWREALFDVRVEGRTPEGASVRIEAITTACYPFM
ncbi:MAG: pilus assembly PilX N-terminal domain-containing protein [Dehalococcoidia bacterium]